VTAPRCWEDGFPIIRRFVLFQPTPAHPVAPRQRPAPTLRHLTPREREVLEMVCATNGNRHAAAALLGMSLRTLRWHAGNIVRSARVTNVDGACELMKEDGE
jgi:FixJ family two-component response regulator